MVRSKINQKLYVIKSIRLSSNANKNEEDSRWMEEIKILEACKHINVIRYKNCFITTETQCDQANPSAQLIVHIVMEYADAGDMNVHIKRQREVQLFFAEAQVRNWLVQLSLALQYLHKIRVMHRDIKTQNIFMTSTKLLKLGDFGVSKVLSPGKEFTETAIGTPTNLCPEIANGQKYDFKSDIWSLGCVVHEICCLKPAFQSKSWEEMLKKIRTASYPPIPSSYSVTLSDLIRVMLKVDPARRPTAYQVATCNALKDDFESHLEHVKKLPASSRMSDQSSDSATKNSCSSRGSGDGTSSGNCSL